MNTIGVFFDAHVRTKDRLIRTKREMNTIGVHFNFIFW